MSPIAGSVEADYFAQNEKILPREEVRQAFPKITEQQLGGGVLPFPQTPLGGGVGVCISNRRGRRCISSITRPYRFSAPI